MSLTKVSYSMIQGAVANVLDFGAVGNGIVDDTAAIQAALDSLGNAGGIAYIPNGMFCLVNSNITVPNNATLKGPYSKTGTPGDNTSYPYNQLSSIRLATSATITLNSSAGIDGILIYAQGMTFPISGSYTFAGTAITGVGDDYFVTNSMILGFNQAIYSTGCQRPKILDVNIDCQNGIHIDNCLDVAHVARVHCWPFTAVGTLYAKRTGIAYYFTNIGDWNKVFDSFCWGYQTGFRVTDCNAMEFVGCGADSPGAISGQVGFLISGASNDTVLNGCQAAAQESGIYVFTNSGLHTTLIGCNVWSNTTNGIVIENGDTTIVGSSIRDTEAGVNILSNTSNVILEALRFYNIGSVGPIASSVLTNLVIVGKEIDYGNWSTTTPPVNTNISYPVVASASTLQIPNNQNFITITGTTNINSITNGWAGREINLLFTGILTVVDGTNLKLQNNFVTLGGSILKLISNGSEWYEVSRSPN
jgi:hypothetical protein